MDVNQHVNNTNYIDFAYEVLPKELYENCDFKNVEIEYKHELRLGDKIDCIYTKPANDEHIVTIKNSNTGVVNAVVKLF